MSHLMLKALVFLTVGLTLRMSGELPIDSQETPCIKELREWSERESGAMCESGELTQELSRIMEPTKSDGLVACRMDIGGVMMLVGTVISDGLREFAANRGHDGDYYSMWFRNADLSCSFRMITRAERLPVIERLRAWQARCPELSEEIESELSMIQRKSDADVKIWAMTETELLSRQHESDKKTVLRRIVAREFGGSSIRDCDRWACTNKGSRTIVLHCGASIDTSRLLFISVFEQGNAIYEATIDVSSRPKPETGTLPNSESVEKRNRIRSVVESIIWYALNPSK